MRNFAVKLLALIGSVVLPLGAAQAAIVTDSMLVDITVLEVCSLTVNSDVNFGSVTPGVTGDVQSNGEIEYACSKTTVADVEIDSGAARQMTNGTTNIVYTLGQDDYVSNGGSSWGLDGAGDAVGIVGAGVSTPIQLPVYGEVLAAAYEDAETTYHSQTVTVNLIY